MKCIEARRMVAPFIRRELSEKELDQFLKHIEHCSDCMDELDIYYTMYKALDTLDSGTHHEYDFKKMLAEEIRSARRMLHRRRFQRMFGMFGLFVVEILLILSVMTGYLLQNSETGGNFLSLMGVSWSLQMQEDDRGETDSKTQDQTEQPTEAQTQKQSETQSASDTQPESQEARQPETQAVPQPKPQDAGRQNQQGEARTEIKADEQPLQSAAGETTQNRGAAEAVKPETVKTETEKK